MYSSTLSGAFITNAFCLKTIIAPLFCDMFSQLSWVLSPVFNFFFARDPKREKKAHSIPNWPLLRVQQPFKICTVSFPVTRYNVASRHIQYCMPLALKTPTVKCEHLPCGWCFFSRDSSCTHQDALIMVRRWTVASYAGSWPLAYIPRKIQWCVCLVCDATTYSAFLLITNVSRAWRWKRS